MHNEKAADQDPPAPWVCTHVATPASSAPLCWLSALPKEAPSATVDTFYYLWGEIDCQSYMSRYSWKRALYQDCSSKSAARNSLPSRQPVSDLVNQGLQIRLTEPPQTKRDAQVVDREGSILPGKWVNKVTVASESHCIGEIMHLDIFVLSPQAPAKISRIIFISTRSCCSAERNTTTSSAYRKVLSLIFWCRGGRRAQSSTTSFNREFNPSITITNNSSD